MKMIPRITALFLSLLMTALCCIASLADGNAPAYAADGARSNNTDEGIMTIAETEAADAIADNAPFDLDCKSAVLIDLSTGTVLYAKNATEALPPASVTKIMTLLLTMEALDAGQFSLTDSVQISEYASSMGGSQVFLKAGETMGVEDLIKSTVIASANDGAVALAELVAGSVEGFVVRMNERAAQLGMTSTHFENPTGLDDDVTNHVTSAYDIALMSRELSKHDKIFSYSSIWMDSIRDGAFGLTNTNRLVRFYQGATGLKTGSTAAAGFCISATAKRNDLHLCAVIMGSPTRDVRNEAAKQLLDWGFANYFLYHADGASSGEVCVKGGAFSALPVSYGEFTALLPSSSHGKVETAVELPESVAAPICTGDIIGRVVYSVDGECVGEVPITADCDAPRISFGQLLVRILAAFLLK